GPYSCRGLVFNGEYEILRRNPNYGGRRPGHMDAIAFREGVDTQKALGRVAGGHYDALQQYDPLLAPGGVVAARIGAHRGLHGLSYFAFPTRATSYIALDAHRPPFSDPRLRAAVAAALDRTTLAKLWSLTPTAGLLPPGVRGVEAPKGATPARHEAPAVRVPGITVRLAVQAGDDRQRQLADAVGASLAPLGLDVVTGPVPDVRVALRDHADVQLASLTTSIDYPDPASFLSQMLGGDVPVSWLPVGTRAEVAGLQSLWGDRRDRAALATARAAQRANVVVAYGTQFLGTVAGPRVGCRVWNGVEPGLDRKSVV